MPAKRSPIPLAYKLRTATMATDYKGSHSGGLELLFIALPDALARRKMIDALEKVHAKLLARESGPDLDDAQRDAAQVASLASQVHPESALPSLTPQGHAVRLATEPPRVCWAGRDGECTHAGCPQLRDGEPAATGRHCPLDVEPEEA